MNEYGFFFFSEKQLAARRRTGHPDNFCQTVNGQIRQYTEWVHEGPTPGGSWDDYVALGWCKYHHSVYPENYDVGYRW